MKEERDRLYLVKEMSEFTSQRLAKKTKKLFLVSETLMRKFMMYCVNFLTEIYT